MANFRCERLFLMLDEPIPGLDHLRAVDPEQFAWHGTDREAELEACAAGRLHVHALRST